VDMDFRMYYKFGTYDNIDDAQPNVKEYVVDTILNGQRIFFEAQPGADLYEWIIGLETTPRKGQNIKVDFNIPNEPQFPITIDVTLTAKYNEGNNCNNYQDNKKVVKKKFCIMPKPAYIGRFLGTDIKAPYNPYIVEIFYGSIYDAYDTYIVKNLATPFFSTSPYMKIGYKSYREFEVYKSLRPAGYRQDLSSINDFNHLKTIGNCWIDRNTIRISYNMITVWSRDRVEYENRTFIGTRIP
jgi:hypothetical protein